MALFLSSVVVGPAPRQALASNVCCCVPWTPYACRPYLVSKKSLGRPRYSASLTDREVPSWLAPAWRIVEAGRVTADGGWIAALRGPEKPARARVVAELREFLRRTLAKGFGRQLSDADLEDVTQESLLRVYRKLDSFSEQSRFSTWAAAIAVNYALSELRRRRYHHVSLEEATEQADWAGDGEDGEADVQLLRQGIAEALTERQRVAIQAALGGLPLMELARREGVTQGAVYKLLHDARRRLRSYLEMKRRTDGTLQEVQS